MHKGDSVITDHPDSRSNNVIRSYGIVQKVTKSGHVIIKLADGSLIKRPPDSIAVYIKTPSNWRELYKKQDVSAPSAQQMLFRGLPPKQQQNQSKH